MCLFAVPAHERRANVMDIGDGSLLLCFLQRLLEFPTRLHTLLQVQNEREHDDADQKEAEAAAGGDQGEENEAALSRRGLPNRQPALGARGNAPRNLNSAVSAIGHLDSLYTEQRFEH
ncbi:MAG: hypothetical protein GY719_35655 [bacterium]|nr:hypothetical protein [bacterium]